MRTWSFRRAVCPRETRRSRRGDLRLAFDDFQVAELLAQPADDEEYSFMVGRPPASPVPAAGVAKAAAHRRAVASAPVAEPFGLG